MSTTLSPSHDLVTQPPFFTTSAAIVSVLEIECGRNKMHAAYVVAVKTAAAAATATATAAAAVVTINVIIATAGTAVIAVAIAAVECRRSWSVAPRVLLGSR